jgi:hypothetical protein
MARHLVTLEAMLANVQRGRLAYLVLTQEQKRALRDPEGQIALDVLRHLLGARPMVPERSSARVGKRLPGKQQEAHWERAPCLSSRWGPCPAARRTRGRAKTKQLE